jgi:hypothetical protein
MGFVRAEVKDDGMCRQARVGDAWLANPLVTTNSSAGNQSITMPAILGGVALFTGAAGAVAYTLPATADIIAALPNMDIGDSYVFKLCNTAAQTATITAGDGSTTLAGFTTVNAATRTCIISKTAAATVTVTSI